VSSTHSHEDGTGREIARGLVAAMRAALEAHHEPELRTRTLIWQASVDVAELLELDGLADLLNACAAHAANPPSVVVNVLDRLERMAKETEARGDLVPFTSADRELGALAGTLSQQKWSHAEIEGPPVSVQPLGELLSDLRLDRPGAVASAQVTLPVAAALRAALDWIGADTGGVVRVHAHDAALTLTSRVTHEPGLGPAGAVLALSGGALLPEPDGRWALRVPLHVERPAFLLARQGQLSLAIPWHAVAKLRIADDTARAVMTEPSLTPWSPLVRATGERPAALLALGLTRAWLHLDHIVWRVFARPEPAQPQDAVPGGRHVVRTSEGGEYWLVDAAEALAGMPALATPPPQARPRLQPEGASPVAPVELPAELADAAGPEPELSRLWELAPTASDASEPVARETWQASLPGELDLDEPQGSDDVEEPVALEVGCTDEPAAATAIPTGTAAHTAAPGESTPAEPAPDAWPVLGPADVRPLPRASVAVSSPQAPVPSAPPADAPVAVAAVATPAVTRSGRRALIVDDSLIARLTLGRVLENEGWSVEWVERAADMWEALRESEWHALFVDVSLPDASGRPHLQALTGVSRSFEIIALTREPAEDRLARASGVRLVLRKPFDPDYLEQFIRRLPAPTDRP
jgi:CheY-like chemotaxis protein